MPQLSSVQLRGSSSSSSSCRRCCCCAVVALVLLPLLSKVGTLGKNIINTFDLLTGEWLWWKLHWNCAREQAEPEEKQRKNNKKEQPEQPHFMA